MARPRVELADLPSMDAEIRRRSFAFNRRPGARNNRGRISEGYGAAPPSPSDILGPLAWRYRLDTGVAFNAGNVAGLTDITGNGNDAVQASAPAQLLWVANQINGMPVMRGNGTAKFLDMTWTRPTPLAQPYYLWMLFKPTAWANFNCLIGGTGLFIRQLTTTPQIVMTAGGNANANSAGTVGSFWRLEAQFTNSAADYLKIGPTEIGGASASTGASSTTQLMANGAGSSCWNGDVAEMFCRYGTPTPAERADLDARYGIPTYGAAPF